MMVRFTKKLPADQFSLYTVLKSICCFDSATLNFCIVCIVLYTSRERPLRGLRLHHEGNHLGFEKRLCTKKAMRKVPKKFAGTPIFFPPMT